MPQTVVLDIMLVPACPEDGRATATWGTSPMLRKSAKDRREELIEAAIRVLLRDGVGGATTRAIAAEAGAPLATFHYCFSSREELLEEAGRRITDRAVSAARDAFTGEKDLRGSLAGLLRNFWQGVEDAPEKELVGYELRQYALRQQGTHELAVHQVSHYLEVHEKFLRMVADNAGIEWTVPVDILARYVHASLDGLSLCWLVDKDSERSLQVLDLMVDYLVGCARPRRQA
jgi:AcrR family transcriptional regulator